MSATVPATAEQVAELTEQIAALSRKVSHLSGRCTITHSYLVHIDDDMRGAVQMVRAWSTLLLAGMEALGHPVPPQTARGSLTVLDGGKRP